MCQSAYERPTLSLCCSRRRLAGANRSGLLASSWQAKTYRPGHLDHELYTAYGKAKSESATELQIRLHSSYILRPPTHYKLTCRSHKTLIDQPSAKRQRTSYASFSVCLLWTFIPTPEPLGCNMLHTLNRPQLHYLSSGNQAPFFHPK